VNVGAVILAAGFSRRLGRAKQSVVFQGSTLLERAIATAQEAGLRPVVAVVSDVSWVEILRGRDAVVLENAEAQEGMAASVRLGVGWLQDQGVTGAVVMACDQPGLRAEHLRALCEDLGRVTGSSYAGRVGVPAYFPAAVFGELLALRGDAGARRLLQGAASVRDELLALDVDTEEDLLRARERFGGGDVSYV
jgi:molybdenum cofactor cytidylyltransferase